MTRFIFLLFAAAMGLVGVTVGLYLLLLVLCSMNDLNTQDSRRQSQQSKNV